MSSHLSRADLLNTLCASANEHLYPALAEALGYEPKPPDTVTEPQRANQNSASGHGNGGDIEQGAADVTYLPKREQRYWIVETGQPRERQPLGSGDWPETEPDEDSAMPQALPEHPLRSDGQWQNLWDSALAGRRRGRNIELKRSLRLLIRSEPVHDLPRCERSSFNRPVVVMLEWGEALYPIWPDMRMAWITLSRLLGKRALRGFYMADGPFNEWRCLHRRSRGSYIDIPAASQVMLIGGFGMPCAEKSAEMNAEWRRLIRRLDKDGHQTTLITAHHLSHPPCPVHTLEPSPPPFPSQAAGDALLAAIARHCLPDRLQLRHLRQALPGATVAAELAVWQHDHTLCRDGYLQITDSAASQWRDHWRDLPPQVNHALESALAQCRAGQDRVACDMSRLQNELEQTPQAGRFPALQALGREVKRNRLAEKTNRHAQFLMRSLLPGLRELADTQPEAGWRPLMAEAQRLAMQSNAPLPLKDQGLDELGGRYRLYQHHQQLRLATGSGVGQLSLLELSSLPYCRETRGILPRLSPRAYDALNLADSDYDYRLKAIRRPSWAERIWRDRDGLYAAHADGALFRLQEAG
ncbi:MAG: hypothetical protein KZQ76_09000 [Candidatus Thiodiazotropha sp. (ex Epidulcina cf. delphinae)]|nr:hypothetical protein [Candidatus Thiodiazotropha sp. (ex Epidulcina cf. delphinae)]